jgi:hypothetical protein
MSEPTPSILRRATSTGAYIFKCCVVLSPATNF